MRLHFYFRKFVNIYATKFWTPINKIAFKLNGIHYGANLQVRGKVYCLFHQLEGRVDIGDDVYINSSAKANPIGCGDGMYIQMVDNGHLMIGNNCGISNAAFTCANSIVLEDNVLLGSGCKIYDTDFHALEYTERVKGNYKGAPINTAPVKIDEGVFIGAGSFVLKGVHIGKHSIIGAGSVVTKDIPKNEIWAGNPAKFIRKIED